MKQLAKLLAAIKAPFKPVIPIHTDWFVQVPSPHWDGDSFHKHKYPLAGFNIIDTPQQAIRWQSQ